MSVDGIKINLEKIKAVADWPTPESVSEVRSSFRACIVFKEFIKNFSTLAFPIIHLTQKNRKFIWSGECDIAFQNLKQALFSISILSWSICIRKGCKQFRYRRSFVANLEWRRASHCLC